MRIVVLFSFLLESYCYYVFGERIVILPCVAWKNHVSVCLLLRLLGLFVFVYICITLTGEIAGVHVCVSVDWYYCYIISVLIV